MTHPCSNRQQRRRQHLAIKLVEGQAGRHTFRVSITQAVSLSANTLVYSAHLHHLAEQTWTDDQMQRIQESAGGQFNNKVLANLANFLLAKHDTTSTTCRVLYFTATLRLAINCDILREAVVDPVPSLAVPTTLIHQHRSDRNDWSTLTVEVLHKIIDQLPSFWKSPLLRGIKLATPP